MILSEQQLAEAVEAIKKAIWAHGPIDPNGFYDSVERDIEAAAQAAITAALPIIEPQWQPIETAPKDGTPFIGAFWSIRWADSHRKGDIVRCWWQSEFEAFISSCRQMTLAPGYTFGDTGETSQLHSPCIEPVTHWMPLPAPPAILALAEEAR